MSIVAFSGRGLHCRRRVGSNGSAAGCGGASVQLVDLHQIRCAEAVTLAKRASALLGGLDRRVAVLEIHLD